MEHHGALGIAQLKPWTQRTLSGSVGLCKLSGGHSSMNIFFISNRKFFSCIHCYFYLHHRHVIIISFVLLLFNWDYPKPTSLNYSSFFKVCIEILAHLSLQRYFRIILGESWKCQKFWIKITVQLGINLEKSFCH